MRTTAVAVHYDCHDLNAVHPCFTGGFVRIVKNMLVTAAATSMCGVVLMAAPASAASDTAKSNFSNGATLTANVWIATFASGSCADFQTSAVISNGHNPGSGDWVRNKTRFEGWGVSPSLKAFDQTGEVVSAEWTNGNGSRGSYMSGNVCSNWRTLGVVGSTTATAFYNGQTKVVTAST